LQPGGSLTTGATIKAAFGYDLLITVLTLGREEQFRKRLLEPAELQPGESVLDIGCGTGSLALVAATQVGPVGKVTGVDPSPEMILRAKRKAARKSAPVRFEISWAQALPFPDRSFDVVLSTVMLHHIPRAGREDAQEQEQPAPNTTKPHHNPTKSRKSKIKRRRSLTQ
jgi:ubiquinone/menaquinone biosynthesis C-methylase UbiE